MKDAEHDHQYTALNLSKVKEIICIIGNMVVVVDSIWFACYLGTCEYIYFTTETPPTTHTHTLINEK